MKPSDMILVVSGEGFPTLHPQSSRFWHLIFSPLFLNPECFHKCVEWHGESSVVIMLKTSPATSFLPATKIRNYIFRPPGLEQMPVRIARTLASYTIPEKQKGGDFRDQWRWIEVHPIFLYQNQNPMSFWSTSNKFSRLSQLITLESCD